MSALTLSADEKQFIDAYRPCDAHGKRCIERMLLVPAEKAEELHKAIGVLSRTKGSMSRSQYLQAVDEILDRICPQPN